MKEQQLSAKQLKQRKFLTVLPVLVLPFLTFFFWFFGGGKVEEAQAEGGLTGINAQIPMAVTGKQPSDKMRYYEQAERDSAELAEQQRNDPYYNSFQPAAGSDEFAHGEYPAYKGNLDASVYPGGYDENPEEKLLAKLEQLHSALGQPDTETAGQDSAAYMPTGGKNLSLAGDIGRLEQMMAMIQPGGGNEDPEMQQINSMLETILDIQHPGRVQQRLRQTSQERKGEVFPVAAFNDDDVVTSLDTDKRKPIRLPVTTASRKGFYSMDDQLQTDMAQNAIEAVVHESQVLTGGSTVKLRLLSDVFINGRRIPKGHFVFGTAGLNGERLEITIDYIRYGASIFPVSLAVHDMDGMAGIHIPGAITRDVMKQSGGQSLQGVGMTAMDPSFGAQAASAGIELGKNLLSRKIRLVKVQVKAGYKVLLVDQEKDKS